MEPRIAEIKLQGERHARSAGAPFTCPIQNNTPLTDIGVVPYLPKSALACWWSITHLIRSAGDCYLWTFTSADIVPDSWFGYRHQKLVRNVGHFARDQVTSSAGGTIPKNWGGVRVFEVHPGGHGLHAHWIIRGRCDWHLMQRAALGAGMGKIVHVHPDPVTPATAYYLAGYLAKQGKIKGVRQWSNIGTYAGLGVKDIHQTSPRIEKIKYLREQFIRQGYKPFVAYGMAIRVIAQVTTGTRDDPY